MTEESCGYGHRGQCCCGCELHLIAKPRCHHLGGVGSCGPYAKTPGVLDRIAADVERAELEERQGITYVCLAFAEDGIAQTDWRAHGSCEMWTKKKTRRGSS